jgi:hypothetical protein
MAELRDYLARKRAGKPAVDPLATTQENYLRQMRKLGFAVDMNGKVTPLPAKKKAVK